MQHRHQKGRLKKIIRLASPRWGGGEGGCQRIFGKIICIRAGLSAPKKMAKNLTRRQSEGEGLSTPPKKSAKDSPAVNQKGVGLSAPTKLAKDSAAVN
jgi:hypothetical protein